VALFGSSLVLYFVAALVSHLGVVTRKRGMTSLGLGLVALGGIMHGAVIIQRWIDTRHPPMVQLYDLTLMYSWLIVVVALAVGLRFSVLWLRPVSGLIGALGLASTSFMDNEIRPLIPALQSNWLTIHVATSFLSYAGFTVAFIFGLAYIAARIRRSASDNTGQRDERYESLVYRCVLFGFPLLTIGIVTGSVWAKSAWASYWSWDPKETWSLITWLVYAIYLHLRRRPWWRGKHAVVLNMVGFAAVLVTWFGVNYLIAGLHSYK